MKSAKMVKVTMGFIGPMRLPTGGHVVRKRVPSGTPVKKLLAAAGYSLPEMKAMQVIAGNRILGLEKKLIADAQLKVFLRLGGG